MVNGEGMFYGDVRKSGCIWLIGSVHLPMSSCYVIPVVFVTYGEENGITLTIVCRMLQVSILFVL